MSYPFWKAQNPLQAFKGFVMTLHGGCSVTSSYPLMHVNGHKIRAISISYTLNFYSHYSYRLKTHKLLLIVLAGVCSDIAVGRICEVPFRHSLIVSAAGMCC